MRDCDDEQAALSGADAGPADSAKAQAIRHARAAVCLCFALHLLGVTLLAGMHPNFARSHNSTLRELTGFQVLVLAEAIVLFLPGLLIGIALASVAPRTAFAVACVAMAFVVPWYYTDFLVHRVFGLRLIEPETWRLAMPVLTHAGDFTLQSKNRTVLVPVAVFVISELLVWTVATRTSRWLPRHVMRKALLAGSFACFAILIAAAVRLATAPSPRIPLLPTTDPHPIHLTGLFDRKPRFTSPTASDRRRVAQWVAMQSSWDEAEKRYGNLKVVGAPARRPDVVILIVESLRHDAIRHEAAPHLTQFAERSLVGLSHFSTGNATPLGYFGILYGLNVLGYERAVERDLPPAFPSLMQQMGYECVFVGSWALDGWRGMDRFLSDRRFDRFEMHPMGASFVEGDRAVVARARAMLDRTGEFVAWREKPLFLVVQVNTTHYEFHSEPEDQLFSPLPATGPPWDETERRLAANLYSNSVHCMDRLVSPLLDAQRLVVVVGDHGESLGEDGYFLHCSALSPAQTRTPLIIHVPEHAPQRLRTPTSHLDILPTVLDALDVAVSDSATLHGRSLLDSAADASRATLVIGDFRLTSWLAMDRENADGGGSCFRFTANPAAARVQFEGAAEPADWSVMTAGNCEGDFAPVFQRMLDQLCAGTAPKPPVDACDSLLESVRHSDLRLRLLAIERLSEFGSAGERAVPVLRELLESEHPQIRAAASEALSKLKSGR
jgi:hypothetical protein